MNDLAETIDDLRRRISELERILRFQARTGVVEQVDAAKGLARIRLQDGNPPFLTGWLPWEEAAAGANKTHNPPSVGQQVRISSESGDLTDASIQASLNSDANGRPSQAGDEYVLLQVGKAVIKVTGGGSTMVFQVGDSRITMTAGGIVAEATRIDLN